MAVCHMESLIDCAMANDDVFDFQQSENYVKFNEQ